MTKSNRVTRKPLSKKGPLVADIRKGYTGRWVNLHGNKYEDALEMGYQVVPNKKKRGDAKVVDADPLASAIVKVVNRGDGLKAVLMEVPTDIYDARQADKMLEIDEIEDAFTDDMAILKKELLR